jgi:hypothetical protein
VPRQQRQEDLHLSHGQRSTQAVPEV